MTDWEDYDDELLPEEILSELEEASKDPMAGHFCGKFECEFCGLQFDYEEELDDHEATCVYYGGGR